MREEQAAQSAGFHFTGQVRVVDMASDAITPLLCGSVKRLRIVVATNGGLRRFLARGPGQQIRILTLRCRPRWTEHPRSEVSHGVLDDSRVESVESRQERAVLCTLFSRVSPAPQRRGKPWQA